MFTAHTIFLAFYINLAHSRNQKFKKKMKWKFEDPPPPPNMSSIRACVGQSRRTNTREMSREYSGAKRIFAYMPIYK